MVPTTTVQLEKLLPGIHGLRGIAALAIVLYHIVHIAKISVPETFSFVSSMFGMGVHLFFVVSAFSLMHSTEHTIHRAAWAAEYFVKRFFRIAPLFYCILAGMVLWPVVKSNTFQFTVETLLQNLTFTFGFAPWSGIVWGGWTIGVEMLFYAIFPVFLLTVRSTFATFSLVIVTILVAYASRSVLSVHYDMSAAKYGYNWAGFSFTPNLCFFTLGILAFRLRHQIDNSSLVSRLLIPAFSVVLLCSLLFSGTDLVPKFLKGDPIAWGIGFATLCIWQSANPSRWCANWFFKYLGERSYSVYLLHPVIIVLLRSPIQNLYMTLSAQIGAYAFFACALFVLVPLLMLAELTYRSIELPGVGFGRSIIQWMRTRADNSTPVSLEKNCTKTR